MQSRKKRGCETYTVLTAVDLAEQSSRLKLPSQIVCCCSPTEYLPAKKWGRMSKIEPIPTNTIPVAITRPLWPVISENASNRHLCYALVVDWRDYLLFSNILLRILLSLQHNAQSCWTVILWLWLHMESFKKAGSQTFKKCSVADFLVGMCRLLKCTKVHGPLNFNFHW